MRPEKIIKNPDANSIALTEGADALRALCDAAPASRRQRAGSAESTNGRTQSSPTAARAKRRFTLYAELLAECSKEWLVFNFLGAGEASCMYGKPGDGKSVLGEDLGLHVAAGKRW